MKPSSMFPAGEISRRKCDSMDMRGGPSGFGNVAAETDYKRRNGHRFHWNQMMCSPSDSFQDLMPNMHEMHDDAGTIYGGPGGHDVQRRVVHSICTCGSSGHQPEVFHDRPDDRQNMNVGNKRYRHGIPTGSSTTFTNQTGHHFRSACDRGCCSSEALCPPGTRSGGGNNSAVDRSTRRPSSRGSLFVDAHPAQRNAVAVGSVPDFPSTLKGSMRTSAVHSGSMGNNSSGCPSHHKANSNQIILYGWFLMKPSRENYSTDEPPTSSEIAIGGYRLPRMEETDFFGTASVVQRLERWKLRTSDGLEIGLMGMINIEKSVSNGFSPSLVRCFTIGFPSAWVHMLLDWREGVPRCSPSPEMLLPSGSPANSAGPATGFGFTSQGFKTCSGASNFLSPAAEANAVESMFQSRPAAAATHLETEMPAARRFLETRMSSSLDGVSSDANSVPEIPLCHDEQLTDAPQPEQPLASGECQEAGCCLAQNSDEVPQTSSQTQQDPTMSNAVLSDRTGLKAEGEVNVSLWPSQTAHSEDMIAGVVKDLLANDGGAEEEDYDEKGAGENHTCVTQDDIPSTPRKRTGGRLQSNKTNTTAADTSPIDPEITPQQEKICRLGGETPESGVQQPITESRSRPQTRESKRRKRSDSHSPVTPDVPVGEPTDEKIHPVANEGTSTARTRKRKKTSEQIQPIHNNKPITRGRKMTERNEWDSPANAHVPVGEPTSGKVNNSMSESETPAQTRERRKRHRKGSLSPVSEITETPRPVVNSPLTKPGTTPPQETRGQSSKRQRNESHPPVAIDIAMVDLTSSPTYSPLRSVKTRRGRKKRLRSDETHSAGPATLFQELFQESERNISRKSQCQVSTSPAGNEEYSDAELGEGSAEEKEDLTTKIDCQDSEPGEGSAEEKVDLTTKIDCQDSKPGEGSAEEKEDLTMKIDCQDIEVDQSCKTAAVEVKARKRRFKIPRNYYHSRKKKKTRFERALEKKKPAINAPTTLETSTEGNESEGRDEEHLFTEEENLEPNVDSNEDCQVKEEEITEPPKDSGRKSGSSTKSTRRDSAKLASSQVVSKGSAENTPTKKSIVPPPLPSPRVSDKSEVTEAFGLKRSRHGRVLVPPVATWRCQTIKYDKDGGIIAISDGFSIAENESCTGYFKPPADKDAKTMQRRLCKAAEKVSRKA